VVLFEIISLLVTRWVGKFNNRSDVKSRTSLQHICMLQDCCNKLISSHNACWQVVTGLQHVCMLQDCCWQVVTELQQICMLQDCCNKLISSHNACWQVVTGLQQICMLQDCCNKLISGHNACWQVVTGLQHVCMLQDCSNNSHCLFQTCWPDVTGLPFPPPSIPPSIQLLSLPPPPSPLPVYACNGPSLISRYQVMFAACFQVLVKLIRLHILLIARSSLNKLSLMCLN
jgi:hypothetical protein